MTDNPSVVTQTQDERHDEMREEVSQEALEQLQAWAVQSRERRLERLTSISDEEWAAAEREDAQNTPDQVDAERSAKQGWQERVQNLSRVQTLVHLAMRMDSVAIDELAQEIYEMRLAAYNNELTIQAQRVGCSARIGALGNPRIQEELLKASLSDAQSIASTYNSDLIIAIQNIFTDTPTANRFVYASRLAIWEEERDMWKQVQIEQYTNGTARSRAQRDFSNNNNIQGAAELKPETAVCPICQGWIDRGRVDMQIALHNPGPFHPNCPHLWRTYPNEVADCESLWVGG